MGVTVCELVLVSMLGLQCHGDSVPSRHLERIDYLRPHPLHSDATKPVERLPNDDLWEEYCMPASSEVCTVCQ